MVTKVLLRLPEPTHALFRIVAENPPDGYQYLSRKTMLVEQAENPVLRQTGGMVYRGVTSNGVFAFARNSYLLARERVVSFFSPTDCSIVFSLTPYTAFRGVPIILWAEYVSKESAVNAPLYRTLLLKGGIKKILAYSPRAAETFRSVLTDSEMRELVSYLYVGVRPPPRFPKQEGEVVNLLFLASGNYGDEHYATVSFLVRGGPEVLATFRELNRRYGNRVRLVIRSQVPRRFKEMFADVLGLPNVTLHEGFLPREQLEQMLRASHILLYPGFRFAVTTISEAYAFGICVAATDCYDAQDYITPGVTGITVHRDAGPKLVLKNHVPFWVFDEMARNPVDEGFVRNYADAVSDLIDDRAKRRSLVERGRLEVEEGRLSIPYMKRYLADTFEEVLSSGK